MKTNIDHYEAVHKELIEQARDLAKQQRGSGCIGQLKAIEDDLVLRLNEYIRMYNGEKDASADIMARQERALANIEEQFRAAPIVCY